MLMPGHCVALADPFDPDITTEDGKPRDPMALRYDHDVRVSLSLHVERFEKRESGGAELAALRPMLRRLAGVSIIRYEKMISLHQDRHDAQGWG